MGEFQRKVLTPPEKDLVAMQAEDMLRLRQAHKSMNSPPK